MQTDPTQLAERARRGEPGTAVELIELFYEKIYAFLRRLTANDADAADLTQRTFGRVWQSLPTFEGRSSVASWIYSIAYHTYVDWRRANHRTESRSREWWDARVCGAPGPDEAVSRKDLAAKLYASVERLAPELRDTVHLHYYQELTLQETADALEVATSTVKYRLRQALSELEATIGSEPTRLSSPATSRNL
jgi:RNA polymerase sigma-70 factor (ECF subfamily)